MPNFYEPSNKFSYASFGFFLLACLTVIPLLALIYAYAIWYIPIPYINFFITAGFGLGIGLTIQYLAVKLGKVRNGKLATFFGFLGALIGLYISWAIWVDLVINAGESYGTEDIGIAVSNIEFLQVFNLVLQPSLLFDIIGQLNEVGVWGISGGTVKGTPLTITWIIEALIVLVLGTITPSGKSGEPFCEVNNKWFADTILPPYSFIENPVEFVTALTNDDQSQIQALTKVTNAKSDSHSIFTLYANETNENYLSIENKRAKLNDKGETEFDNTNLITYLEISEAVSNALSAI